MSEKVSHRYGTKTKSVGKLILWIQSNWISLNFFIVQISRGESYNTFTHHALLKAVVHLQSDTLKNYLLIVQVFEVDPDKTIDEDIVWVLSSVNTKLALAMVQHNIIVQVFFVLDVSNKIAAKYFS